MKRILVLGLALLILLSILPMGVMGSGQGKVPVIIGFKETPSPELVEKHGGNVKIVYHIIPAIAADLPPQAIEALKKDPNVQYVEPDRDYQYLAEVLPWGVDRIDAESAWFTSEGSGVNVAFLDTGVDKDHPDLVGNIEGGYSVISGNNFDDNHGHGTFVAGIIAAAVDNNIGVIGVGPEIDLWAVQISKGRIIKGSSIVAGIEWCVDTHDDGIEWNDIQVMSMSFGGYGVDTAVRGALQVAYGKGIVLVAAAGNDGTSDPMYPAGYGTVIAVSATAKDDNIASWSNYGDWIELAAPGVDIYSTAKDGGYTTASGTSASCPHVSGTAALAIYFKPEHTNEDIRGLLCSTADDLGDPGFDVYYGWGLVDAEEAATGEEKGDDLSTAEPTDRPPSVSIIDPKDTISGTYRVKVSATDDNEVSKVELSIDGGTYIDITINFDGTYYYYDWDTTTVSDGSHTLDARATDSASQTTDASQVTVTVDNVPGGTMHVESIDFKQKGPRWLDIMVTIYDDAGSPVTEATVDMDIDYEGSFYSVSAVTNGDGIATHQISWPAEGTYTVTVTDVTHDTLTYDPGANKETTDSYTVT